ncbi:glycosyltransferase family 2 protein [bacterium]|nr:glycosyltransferase family 2 protein [bacterium]
MTHITASIVTYNNPLPMLEKAVSSFLNTPLDVRLYIVDNSPQDTLRSAFSDPRITYIFNDANLGYGTAHNIAIRRAMASGNDYHIVLNPDIYFDKGVIEALALYMDRHPDVGLVMPKVLYPDGTLQQLCKLSPAPKDQFYRRFMPIRSIREKRDELYELRFADFDKEIDAPFLSGSFMFLRLDALKKSGLFDENIFMYLEDADLCRRIHREYRTVYYPHVHIFHEYAKGSHRSRRLLFYHIRSALYYFTKWGWFVDRERDRINAETLRRLRSENRP